MRSSEREMCHVENLPTLSPSNPLRGSVGLQSDGYRSLKKSSNSRFLPGTVSRSRPRSGIRSKSESSPTDGMAVHLTARPGGLGRRAPSPRAPRAAALRLPTGAPAAAGPPIAPHLSPSNPAPWPSAYLGRRSAHPGRPAASPGGSLAHPGESSASPGRPPAHPGEPSASPGGPSAHTGESFANPGRPPAHPGESSASPGGSTASPGGRTFCRGRRPARRGGSSALKRKPARRHLL
jgi:hypothetical protein